MSERKLRVAVIIGSVRSGRFGPAPADWIAAEAAKRDDLDVDVIDLAKAWLPDVLPATAGSPAPQAVRDLAPWLDASDAFVIVTPEYNHSFPASLKNAIDWYADEWKAKPVGFVSYGGIAGGLRAVAQLRQIFPDCTPSRCATRSLSLTAGSSSTTRAARRTPRAPSPRPRRCSTS